MSVFVLMCFSCFAGGESDGWLWGIGSGVKSCVCRLAGGNPWAKNTVLGSVFGAVNNAKNRVVNEVCVLADYWWMNTTCVDKVKAMLLGGLFVSGAAIMFTTAPPVAAVEACLIPLACATECATRPGSLPPLSCSAADVSMIFVQVVPVVASAEIAYRFLRKTAKKCWASVPRWSDL